MDAARVVLLILHNISAGTWIAIGVVDIAFRMILKGNEGKPIELPLFIADGRVRGFMGQVAGAGILITGLALISVEGLGFLNIGGFTPTWLMIKQIIYLVLLAIFVLYMLPRQRKIVSLMIAAARGQPPAVTPEIRQVYGQMLLGGRLMVLLVLVNIVLAVWKPA